jgi:hypothetical protein
MDDVVSTIERLTRERDAAQKRVVLLERIIGDPKVAADMAYAVPQSAWASFLAESGWDATEDGCFERKYHLNILPSHCSPRAIADLANYLERAAALVLADLLDYADAPR